ncbi:MAG: hypothetical protein ABI467_05295, partial [Kofleriaceae bacterium]
MRRSGFTRPCAGRRDHGRGVAVAWLAVAALAAGCGDNKFVEQPTYAWDQRHDVGAYGLDRIAPDDPGLFDAVDHGTAEGAVTLFYGHDPPHGTSYET